MVSNGLSVGGLTVHLLRLCVFDYFGNRIPEIGNLRIPEIGNLRIPGYP